MSYVNRQYSHTVKAPGWDLTGDDYWEHAFSQSFIAGMQLCPEQTRAQWAGEIPREYTDSTALGESFHEGVQNLLLNKRDSHADLEEAVDTAFHHLEGLDWKYTKYSKAHMFASLPIMLDSFAGEILPLVKPAQVELPFKELLYRGKHRTVYVCGTMDCVDEDGLVWDWKSAGREHEVWEHQRWAVQPTVYTYANWRSGLEPEGRKRNSAEPMERQDFRYGVVLLDGSTQVYDVWRDESHVQWLRQQTSQIAWLIENDVKPWVLNDGGWWCSEKWCGKWDSCKGADMPVDWKSKA